MRSEDKSSQEKLCSFSIFKKTKGKFKEIIQGGKRVRKSVEKERERERKREIERERVKEPRERVMCHRKDKILFFF